MKSHSRVLYIVGVCKQLSTDGESAKKRVVRDRTNVKGA